MMNETQTVSFIWENARILQVDEQKAISLFGTNRSAASMIIIISSCHLVKRTRMRKQQKTVIKRTITSTPHPKPLPLPRPKWAEIAL
jgi:hypothetical protein